MTSKVDFKDGGFESEQQKLNRLKEEVNALPDILKPNPNPRTYEMIMAQKRKRRMEHINEMHEFEKDILELRKVSEQKISDLKKEVEKYEANMNGTIFQFMNNLSDEHLLHREIDVVAEIDSFGADIKGRMLLKLDNIDQDLDRLEDEFFDSIQSNIENLGEALVDIGFKLRPEISENIQKIRDGFKDEIEQKKVSNKNYYEEAKARIESKIEELLQQCEAKKASWRKIKNDQVLEEFRSTIIEIQFQDPQDRAECLKKLENYMQECYDERRAKIELLENMPSSELSKPRLEQFLDSIREINDKANEGYDVYVTKLIDLKDSCLLRARQFLDYIKDRLLHYDADLGETTFDEVFASILEPEYTKIDQNQNKLIQEVIDFMEERNKVQHNLCMNFGMDVRNYGSRMEKYLVDLTTTEKKFEYEKAVLEDENEEKLEELTKNLDDAKLALRSSTHHLKLDENLTKCFDCVDEIDKEFRQFHEKNSQVVKQHAPLIEDMFNVLEDDFANLMELRALTKREELEERAEKITKWKAKLAADLQVK